MCQGHFPFTQGKQSVECAPILARGANSLVHGEVHLPCPKIHPMEITMRKTIIFILGTTLTAGSMVQVATAEEQGRRAEDRPVITEDANRGAYDQYRGAYDQSNGPSAPLTPEEERNKEDFGFSGRDPSRVGGESPYFNPPDCT